MPRLDRASELRRDTDRLMKALDAADTFVVPVHRDQSLVVLGAEPRAVLLDAGSASPLIDVASEIVWLGRIGERDCFAIDLSQLDRPETHAALAGRGEFADLRMAGGFLPAEEAEVLAYARGMLYWHRRHRFCGSCGRPTKPRDGGHMRECAEEDLRHFPRTDPAVMVLVSNGERCALARQHGWPEGMFSIVAGFVEPGESTEDAAVREVKEELGVGIGELRYFRSQPWPFPSSLMIGFFAETTDDALVIDRTELEEARWVTREELRDPKGFFYPPPYSLAHHMIRAFIG
jgi:NAD+ diphosphatase